MNHAPAFFEYETRVLTDRLRPLGIAQPGYRREQTRRPAVNRAESQSVIHRAKMMTP